MGISDAEFGEMRSDVRHTKEGITDIKRILEKRNDVYHQRINETNEKVNDNTSSIKTIKTLGKLGHGIWAAIMGYIAWTFKR